MKLVKQYNIGKNTTFDLSKLCQDLEKGTYTIKTQAVSVNGNKSPESTGLSYFVDPLNPLNLPPFTIRCKFKPNYTPTMGTSQTIVDSDNNVWDVGFVNADSLFKFNTDLLEVIGANTSSVTNMDSMFNNCNSLTSVHLFDTSSVTNMDNMFFNCENIITVPLFDTSSVTSMGNMFNGCKFLITVPLFDTSSVTSMGYMFNWCTSLTSVPLVDTSSVESMNNMFYLCSSLTSVPRFDISSVTSMNSMLYKCNVVEGGALALYQQASAKNPQPDHCKTFTDCGKDTATGAAELAQIPTGWGGNA